jgi:hypothetical protein
LIFVFSTGETDDGVRVRVDFVPEFRLKVTEVETDCPLIRMLRERDWEAEPTLSKAEVWHTMLEVDED